MVDSVYKFTLDIHETRVQQMVKVMRGDTKRVFEVLFSEKGDPYYIDHDCYAVFSAEKADGHKIYNDCYIEDGTIFYHLTPQTTTTAGLLKCEIKLYGGDGGLITSPRFTIFVDATINEEDEIEIESADEVNALTALIAETASVKSEIEQKLENGEFIGAPGKDGKDGEKGEQGFSPVVNVSPIEGGHRISVTDESGTQAFDVMDGEDAEGGVDFETDETLSLVNGVLSVNRAFDLEADNTLPITSAAVYETVGNIEILLGTI